MERSNYSSNVFINCPFDKKYIKLRNSILFAIYDCGFIPRCALEENNSGNVRFEKIQKIIESSKYAIHDISRTEMDYKTKLPRFNMPLELGVFIGAKKFGNKRQKEKNCLILDKEKYRYQTFISDIAGHDIQSHENSPKIAITHIRNWLNSESGRRTIPGGEKILHRFNIFQNELPKICRKIHIRISELTYNDYSIFISEWLKRNSTI